MREVGEVGVGEAFAEDFLIEHHESVFVMWNSCAEKLWLC